MLCATAALPSSASMILSGSGSWHSPSDSRSRIHCKTDAVFGIVLVRGADCIGPVGFEPTDLAFIASYFRNRDSLIHSPDLAEVVASWPDLAAPLRAAVLAIVRTATPNGAPKGKGGKP